MYVYEQTKPTYLRSPGGEVEQVVRLIPQALEGQLELALEVDAEVVLLLQEGERAVRVQCGQGAQLRREVHVPHFRVRRAARPRVELQGSGVRDLVLVAITPINPKDVSRLHLTHVSPLHLSIIRYSV